jgi:2-polyprenyl-3-methyl-5-hydroxy-6-metoxy-1,4-benzoquinol methylase
MTARSRTAAAADPTMELASDGVQPMPPSELQRPDGWDARYSDRNVFPGGTLVHTVEGNLQFYRAKYAAIDRCLNNVGVSLASKNVLDAAGGAGAFVPYYLSRGAARVTVADFSEVAIHMAADRFGRDHRVDCRVADMTVNTPDLERRYDFVFVMEAIFLLPDDASLHQALLNLASYLVPGGHLLISNVFREDRQVVNSYVVRAPRNLFERYLAEGGVTVLGYFPQAVLFNRRVFGPAQQRVERMGSLYYWGDRLAQGLGFRPPPHVDVRYLVGRNGSFSRGRVL